MIKAAIIACLKYMTGCVVVVCSYKNVCWNRSVRYSGLKRKDSMLEDCGAI